MFELKVLFLDEIVNLFRCVIGRSIVDQDYSEVCVVKSIKYLEVLVELFPSGWVGCEGVETHPNFINCRRDVKYGVSSPVFSLLDSQFPNPPGFSQQNHYTDQMADLNFLL